MNIRNIYNISVRVLLYPISVWAEISAENRERNELVKEILLPFSLLVGLSSFFGMAFAERIEDGFSLGYLLLNGLISFLIIFLEVYISGWLITRISRSFDPGIDPDRIFNLVIFSQIPFMLTLSITKLFPSLIFLNVLGAYSFFLLWNGIEPLIKLDNQKKPFFMVLSAVIMVLLFLFLNMIFNGIYDGILNRFTTFGI